MSGVVHVRSAILLLALAAAAMAQIGGPSRYPGQPGRGTGLPSPVPDINKGSGKDKAPEEALPSFTGTVKGIDEKFLTLERPDANTMEFHCSKKTRYYDGNKKVKASAIQAGDNVSVEAKRAPDGSLDAVNVRLDRRKPS